MDRSFESQLTVGVYIHVRFKKPRMTSQIRHRHTKTCTLISISNVFLCSTEHKLATFELKTSQQTTIMTTAARKALATPELLEAILLELPSLDLLISQRVNKQFKATVEYSIKAQQKVFLKSPPKRGDGAVTVNPLFLCILHRHFPACRVYVSQDVENKAGTFLGVETISNTAGLICKESNYMCIELGSFDYDSAPTSPWRGSYTKMAAIDSPVTIDVRNESGYCDIISGDFYACTLTLGTFIRSCYLISQGQGWRKKMDPTKLARFKSKVSWMNKANREAGEVPSIEDVLRARQLEASAGGMAEVRLQA